MTGVRTFFLVFYLATAVLGLFAAAAARDAGIAIFGWGMLFFGVLSAFHAIKAHYDEVERH
ncbi:hypothetical protein GXW78_21995 [Roseomonas terrae]|jgi:hypothetical protein|uniref:Uncharacterized protein n=1 Tax=Neoroseomonas terrae TaxID=424799 RepID=A0ABS5EMT7_9PROT|nr:hypothetical protein [Neoroseomonas terrae]MBR0652345.1 hypothetical protein [Neoroseomonas terrae]